MKNNSILIGIALVAIIYLSALWGISIQSDVYRYEYGAIEDSLYIDYLTKVIEKQSREIQNLSYDPSFSVRKRLGIPEIQNEPDDNE